MLLRISKLKKIISAYFIIFLFFGISAITANEAGYIVDTTVNSNSDLQYYTNQTYFEVNMSLTNYDSLIVNGTNASSHVDWNQSLLGYWNYENITAGYVQDNSTYDRDLSYN